MADSTSLIADTELSAIAAIVVRIIHQKRTDVRGLLRTAITPERSTLVDLPRPLLPLIPAIMHLT